MARGWESNDAEEQALQQMEQRAEETAQRTKKEMNAADAVRSRARQVLELKRERILSEKTRHPARRAALQAALEAIEQELANLN